jgi:hypothetical protein
VQNPHTKATPKPDVICTELKNGEAVLLHLGTQSYYTINETGSRIWTLMGQGLTLGEIGKALEAQYEVSPDRAQRCVLDLAKDLAAEELVTLTGADPTA